MQTNKENYDGLCKQFGHVQLYLFVLHDKIILMYGSDTWALRKAEQNLLEGTEMRMLRWMMVITRIEIKNEEI